MNVQQLEETIAYEHKGVVVYLHLDYQIGKVSIIERDGSDKKFLFKERTTEYLGGWVLVFGALTEATKYANIRLKEQAEAKEKLKTSKLIDMMIAIEDKE